MQEVSDLFEFEVPSAKYNPKFKSGYWNGKIEFFIFTGEFPLGLVSKVYSYCKENGYEFTGEYDIVREDITEDEWNEFIDHLTFCSKGEPIAAHSYQVDSVFTALTRGRAHSSVSDWFGESFNVVYDGSLARDTGTETVDYCSFGATCRADVQRF